jgi:hypothetical protein
MLTNDDIRNNYNQYFDTLTIIKDDIINKCNLIILSDNKVVKCKIRFINCMHNGINDDDIIIVVKFYKFTSVDILRKLEHIFPDIFQIELYNVLDYANYHKSYTENYVTKISIIIPTNSILNIDKYYRKEKLTKLINNAKK